MTYIDLYYYNKFGYIIASDVKVKNSIIHTVNEPVIICDLQTTKYELAKYISKALFISEESAPIDISQVGKYKFWHVTNIKSFSAFSKKFKAIEIKKKDDLYEIEVMNRESDGSYAPSKNENELIVLPIAVDYEKIAEIIINLFMNISYNESKYDTFMTLEGNKVSYVCPSDDYESIDDGGTDAYKIYKKLESEDYIAFLIDSGYKEISSDEIKKRWEKMYGKLEYFELKNVEDEKLQCVITSKTIESEYISYIFADGNSILEILLKIDLLNDSIKNIDEEKKEYQKIINSLKIESNI